MYRVTRILLLGLAAAALCVSSVSASPAVKAWTVAVFLNADNNLNPFGLEDQREMSRVGSNDFLNIVTLIDQERGGAEIDYIEKNKISMVKSMGELDMGDYKELVRFAKYIKQNYPAKRYCFVLWNHGSGWRAKNENNIFRGISYDDSSNNHITNNQLITATAQMKEALGQKVDVMVMDACLMQMVEVNHALKGNVGFLVASEEVEPGKGAPYNDILKRVKADMNAKAFAANWVNSFAASYNDGSQGYCSCTQSAVDHSNFSGLLSAVEGLAKALMSGKYSMQVKKAVQLTQCYEYPENIDLVHFAKNLKAKMGSNTSVKNACDKVIEAAAACVAANKKVGTECKNSNGIAIYLPASFRVDPRYRSLTFAKASLWDDMIMYLANSRATEVIVSEAAAGDLTKLRSFINNAKAGKNDASLNRAVLRELNFSAYSENNIPEDAKIEFNNLLNDLKQVIQQ